MKVTAAFPGQTAYPVMHAGHAWDSPYHGDFRITEVFSFYGLPATHLISHDGGMFRIYTDTCGMHSGRFSGCFLRDGELGALRVDDMYIAMADVDAGQIAGLVSPIANRSWDVYVPPCSRGCTVQRVEVASRTVLSERRYDDLDVGVAVVARHDPFADRFVLGYQLGSGEGVPHSGYRVVSLEY